MTAQRRLLLDTNVFVAALITGSGVPAGLVRHAFNGVFALVISPLLLAELTEVLERDKFRRYLTVDEALHTVDELRRGAQIVADPAAPKLPITDDPDDDFLVMLAEAVGVSALVSGDPHLSRLCREGLIVWTPREALDHLDEYRPPTPTL